VQVQPFTVRPKHHDRLHRGIDHAEPVRRTALGRAAAGAVAPGGTLVVVDHRAPPPWASKLDHDHLEFPTADEVVSSLNLDESRWDRVTVAAVERDAVGPAGQQAVLSDNVMVLRRRERRR
jgi:hypothetical protein